MGTLIRVGAIVVVAAVSATAGWWLHRPTTQAPTKASDTIRAPSVDATPQYLAHMAHHFGSPPSDRLRQLKKEALQGSGGAADKVLLSYEDCASTEGYLNLPFVCGRQAEYWFQIARENGSFSGANDAFNALRDSGKCEDVFRARYWLDKMLTVQPGTPWKEASQELRKQEQRCS